MQRRTTAYIYAYYRGEKQCSCGYCRIDVCEKQCKICISVRVPDRYTMGIAKIYILEEENGKVNKTLLGKTGGVNGSISYRYMGKENNVTEGIPVGNIAGILICDGHSMDRAFMAEMTDRSINLNMLENDLREENIWDTEDEWEEDLQDNIQWNGEENTEGMKEHKEQKMRMESNKPEIDGMLKEGMSCEMAGTPSENMKSEISEAPSENMKPEISEARSGNMKPEISEAPSENMKPEISEVRSGNMKPEISGTPSENVKPEMAETSSESCETNMAGTFPYSWQEVLFLKFPKVVVSFGGESSEAVRMRPHDLVWFPRKYWRFSSNKCLLNGYYNYRYIMLVRGVGERAGNYYLAVPGKNTVNEAIAARKQGFSEFVSNKGDFGYWCCKVVQ